jgi:hypothetical protein
LETRWKEALLNLFQLLLLVTPLLVIGLWTAHPYVERDLSQESVSIASSRVPIKSGLEPATQTVIQRSDGTRLVQVTVNEQISVDAALGGQVRNRLDAPKGKIHLDEPVSTRTASSSHSFPKTKKRRKLQYLSPKSVLAILKLNEICSKHVH